MAIDIFKLPKGREELSLVIQRHVLREEDRLSYRRIQWIVAIAYLNGARRFDIWNPTTGQLRWSYTDEEGNLEYQSGSLLSAISKISGRLESFDLSPLIQQTGSSLPGIRERASAQIISDNVISLQQLDKVKRQFAHIFTTLGSCGITGHITDHPTIGITADLEVIHPVELMPFPSVGNDMTGVRGLLRQRWVSFETLKSLYPGRKWNEQLMDIAQIQAGAVMSPPGDSVMLDAPALIHRDGDNPGPGAARSKDTMQIVKVRELWIEGVRETCARFIVSTGRFIITDQDLSDQEIYCPIGFSSFMETGTFHGAGVFDLMFPITREHERLLKSLFNNIRDTDRYGILVLPSGQINKNELLQDVGVGLRVMFWEPDAVAEGFTPFPIQPFNLKDIPGRVAVLAQQEAERINPLRDLLEEKGRVDSAQGLAIIDEVISQAITQPTNGIQIAFGTAYRGIVQKASSMLVSSPRPLLVTRLHRDLAGVVINPKDNTVDFTVNPLPNVGRLLFRVKEVNPRSRVARKAEALELHRDFIIPQNGDIDSF